MLKNPLPGLSGSFFPLWSMFSGSIPVTHVLDASLESENGIGPAAFPAFASPGVVPAFSASSCCPALRLTLAPRAVFPRVLPGHSPGLCLVSPSLPSRAFPLPKACGLPSSVLVGNVHRGRRVVLWAVARVPGLSRCA